MEWVNILEFMDFKENVVMNFLLFLGFIFIFMGMFCFGFIIFYFFEFFFSGFIFGVVVYIVIS